MITFDAYLNEVREKHIQILDIVKHIKENHLSHIEPDIASLKSDVSNIKTDIAFMKDRLSSLENKLDDILSKLKN